MDKEKATKILADYIQPGGGLYCLGHYLSWGVGARSITLDCEFSLEELEAIVWWMKQDHNPGG